jgi:hypothetical protein
MHPHIKVSAGRLYGLLVHSATASGCYGFAYNDATSYTRGQELYSKDGGHTFQVEPGRVLKFTTSVTPLTTLATGTPLPRLPFARKVKPTTTPPLRLVVTVAPRAVISGRHLTVTVRTALRARITMALGVVTTRVVSRGKGPNHVRRVHTVVLYRVVRRSIANARGRVTGSLHITYKPARPVRALLVVTVHAAHRTATRSLWVMIRPVHHHHVRSHWSRSRRQADFPPEQRDTVVGSADCCGPFSVGGTSKFSIELTFLQHLCYSGAGSGHSLCTDLLGWNLNGRRLRGAGRFRRSWSNEIRLSTATCPSQL